MGIPQNDAIELTVRLLDEEMDKVRYELSQCPGLEPEAKQQHRADMEIRAKSIHEMKAFLDAVAEGKYNFADEILRG